MHFLSSVPELKMPELPTFGARSPVCGFAQKCKILVENVKFGRISFKVPIQVENGLECRFLTKMSTLVELPYKIQFKLIYNIQL